jgi:hypothetical protein
MLSPIIIAFGAFEVSGISGGLQAAWGGGGGGGGTAAVAASATSCCSVEAVGRPRLGTVHCASVTATNHDALRSTPAGDMQPATASTGVAIKLFEVSCRVCHGSRPATASTDRVSFYILYEGRATPRMQPVARAVRQF